MLHKPLECQSETIAKELNLIINKCTETTNRELRKYIKDILVMSSQMEGVNKNISSLSHEFRMSEEVLRHHLTNIVNTVMDNLRTRLYPVSPRHLRSDFTVMVRSNRIIETLRQSIHDVLQNKCAAMPDTRWINDMMVCDEDVDICFLVDWSRFMDGGLINVTGPKTVSGMRDNWIFGVFRENAEGLLGVLSAGVTLEDGAKNEK